MLSTFLVNTVIFWNSKLDSKVSGESARERFYVNYFIIIYCFWSRIGKSKLVKYKFEEFWNFTNSIGYPFLRSPLSVIIIHPKQDANFLTHTDFLPSIGNRGLLCAACFSNSHTSECGLRRKGYPINSIVLPFSLLTLCRSSQYIWR